MLAENGYVVSVKPKVTLKRKLQEETPLRLVPQPEELAMTVVQLYRSLIGLIGEPCKSLWTVFSSSYRHHDCSIKSRKQLVTAGQPSRCLKLSLQTPLPLQMVSFTVTENKVQLFETTCHYFIME